MTNPKEIVPTNEESDIKQYEIEDIKQKIYTIRGKQVIIDSDIANWYEVETKRINEAVKRNKKKISRRFLFCVKRK